MRGTMLVGCLCAMMTVGCAPPSDKLLCGSETDPCPGSARWIFDHDVQPLLATTCADCHSNPVDLHRAPDFLDAVHGDYYASLVSRKDFVACAVKNSFLLTKGLEPDHPGGALTEPQRERVERWLLKEAEERFDGACKGGPVVAGGPDTEAETPLPGMDGTEAIRRFGECMTLEDWKETNMPLVALQTATHQQSQSPCYSCHAGGQASNWMPDLTAEHPDQHIAKTFEEMRKAYSIYRLTRWTVHDEDGSFKDIVQSYRWRDKGSDAGHPPYELAPVYQGYVDAWFERTRDRWLAGSCAP